MNEYDSNRILDFAKKINYTQTKTLEETDCYQPHFTSGDAGGLNLDVILLRHYIIPETFAPILLRSPFGQLSHT